MKKTEDKQSQASGSGISIRANLDPIANATPRGIKTVFDLIFWKPRIKAERALELAAAQTEFDKKRITEGLATYSTETNQIINKDEARKELHAFISQAIQEEEVANIIKCGIQAAINMENSPPTEVSDEFILRWRNEARLISDEAAQAVWGKILSEETKNPNSISLRTLEVIKSLSKAEAEAFRDASSFVLFDQYLLDPKDDSHPLTSERFTLLRDAGLIASYTKGFYRGSKWPKTTITYNENAKECYFVRRSNDIIFTADEEIGSEPPTFSYWELTKAGKEMHRIISGEAKEDIKTLINALYKGNEKTIKKLNHTIYTSIENNEIAMDLTNTVELNFN